MKFIGLKSVPLCVQPCPIEEDWFDSECYQKFDLGRTDLEFVSDIVYIQCLDIVDFTLQTYVFKAAGVFTFRDVRAVLSKTSIFKNSDNFIFKIIH